jgi:RND family efflux transporter MFP subunit
VREEGVLTSVDNRIDSRTASVVMRAEFANPQHRLLPGGSVTVILRPRQQQESLTIPLAAVQQDAQGFYSWVLTENNTAELRRLTLGEQQGQRYAVAQGLDVGERVVTEGVQRLRDGAAVVLLK